MLLKRLVLDLSPEGRELLGKKNTEHWRELAVEEKEDRDRRGGGTSVAGAADVPLHLTDRAGAADVPLYLTDRAGAARDYAAAGLPFLVWLHEGNRWEEFAGTPYVCEAVWELDGEYFDRIYRRFAGVPWEILTTARTFLRETTVEDVDAFYEIYREPCITRYMEDLFEDRDREIAYTRDYIEKIYHFFGFGVWTVCHRESGSVIGRAGLSYREGYDFPELGFVIAKPFQGRGIAREVCRAVLELGFGELGFETIMALVHPENVASVGLLKSLGFVEHCRGEMLEMLCGKGDFAMMGTGKPS